MATRNARQQRMVAGGNEMKEEAGASDRHQAAKANIEHQRRNVKTSAYLIGIARNNVGVATRIAPYQNGGKGASAAKSEIISGGRKTCGGISNAKQAK